MSKQPLYSCHPTSSSVSKKHKTFLQNFLLTSKVDDVDESCEDQLTLAITIGCPTPPLKHSTIWLLHFWQIFPSALSNLYFTFIFILINLHSLFFFERNCKENQYKLLTTTQNFYMRGPKCRQLPLNVWPSFDIGKNYFQVQLDSIYFAVFYFFYFYNMMRSYIIYRNTKF